MFLDAIEMCFQSLGESDSKYINYTFIMEYQKFRTNLNFILNIIFSWTWDERDALCSRFWNQWKCARGVESPHRLRFSLRYDPNALQGHWSLDQNRRI